MISDEMLPPNLKKGTVDQALFEKTLLEALQSYQKQMLASELYLPIHDKEEADEYDKTIARVLNTTKTLPEFSLIKPIINGVSVAGIPLPII